MAVVNLFPEASRRDQLLQTVAIRLVDTLVQQERKRLVNDACRYEAGADSLHPKPLYNYYFTTLKEKISSPVPLIESYVKGMAQFQKKMDKIDEWKAPLIAELLMGRSLEDEDEPVIENSDQNEISKYFADEISKIKASLALITDQNFDKQLGILQRGISVRILDSFKGEEKQLLEWFNNPIMKEIARANEVFLQFLVGYEDNIPDHREIYISKIVESVTDEEKYKPLILKKLTDKLTASTGDIIRFCTILEKPFFQRLDAIIEEFRSFCDKLSEGENLPIPKVPELTTAHPFVNRLYSSFDINHYGEPESVEASESLKRYFGSLIKELEIYDFNEEDYNFRYGPILEEINSLIEECDKEIAE